MGTVCKWATIAILVVVFIGLMSFVGSIHVVEYLGSIALAIVAARVFFLSICGKSYQQLARNK